MDKDDIEEINASDVESEIDSVVTEEDLDIVNLDEPDVDEVEIEDNDEEESSSKISNNSLYEIIKCQSSSFYRFNGMIVCKK